jgi:tRNA(Arg) A34 adenosine deaminase TadA
MASNKNDRDIRYLRRAIALAKQSRAGGHHPFGAVVVTDDDKVLVERESRKERGGDATQHSELEAVRAVSAQYSKDVLGRSTLYTSTEPCAMCAGAIYWGGIGRVVYSFPEHRLMEMTGNHPENPTLTLPCRELFARGQRKVEVIGPLIEDEGREAHAGFWAEPAPVKGAG